MEAFGLFLKVFLKSLKNKECPLHYSRPSIFAIDPAQKAGQTGDFVFSFSKQSLDFRIIGQIRRISFDSLEDAFECLVEEIQFRLNSAGD